MKIHHYSVFLTKRTGVVPGTNQKLHIREGGKQFAIVEGVDDPVEMQRIAALTNEPLTGFILSVGTETVEARFFSPLKEKGSSDSGALAVNEHLRRTKRFQKKRTVLMGQEDLEAFHQDGKWWSKQEDMSVFSKLDFGLFSSILSDPTIINQDYSGYLAGGSKKNLVLLLNEDEYDRFHGLRPNMEAIKSLQQSHGLNGVIFVGSWDSARFGAEIRFFSPLKGIPEDNAGSYTVASACGYMCGSMEYVGLGDEVQRIRFFQGDATGKPSMLWVKFKIREKAAIDIQVGGKVELLEVTDA